MAKTFAFRGDEKMGTYVAHQLEELGLSRVAEVADADVAFTYCMHASALEDVYFDEEGLVKQAHEGMVLVDLSPSTPSFSRELSAVSAVNDLVFIEAPLAMSDPAAHDALSSPDHLVCYAACEDEGLDEVKPLLESLASQVIATGAVGTAQLAKVRHTVQMAAQIVGAVESCAFERAVRDASSSVDGLNSSDVSLGDISQAMGAAVADEAYESGFDLAFLMADIVAAMTAADDVELILPQLEAAMHLLELMAVIGGAEKGPAALTLLYREEAAGAAQGLDWSRAANLYDEHSHDDHFHDDYDIDGDGDDDDMFGFAGGFGGYSTN